MILRDAAGVWDPDFRHHAKTGADDDDDEMPEIDSADDVDTGIAEEGPVVDGDHA